MWYVFADQKFKFQNVEKCWILETIETVEKCLKVLLKLIQKWKSLADVGVRGAKRLGGVGDLRC